MKKERKNMMWGGRFKKASSEKLIDFTTRTDVGGFKGADYYLFRYEILGTYAHTLMLMKKKILKEEDGRRIIKILNELEGEKPNLDEYEDIHSYVEDRIISKTGLTPHICRSRNDQVILIERLFMRDGIIRIIGLLLKLTNILLKKSMDYLDIIIPAYTHWQQADITTYSHILSEYIQMLIRDIECLEDMYSLINENPLGACAIAGCSLPIDREYTSILLGFKGIQENTIDVVTSRWEYQAKYMFVLTIIMKHLSTISRDIIFLSTNEISLITLDDAFTTGSSALPHKKNPDPLELIIGKSDKITGYLSSILSIGGDASGYHRESQEGKRMMIEATYETEYSIEILSDIIETMEVSRDKTFLLKPTLILPELANQIAFKLGVSFRKVHEIIGGYVSKNEDEVINLQELNRELRKHGVEIDLEEIGLGKFSDFKKLIDEKNHIGAPGDVKRYVKDMEGKLYTLSTRHKNMEDKLESVLESLHKKVLETMKTG